MKNIALIILIVLPLVFSACRKGDDPSPDKQCYPTYVSKMNGNDISHFTYDDDYKINRLQRTITSQRQNYQTTYRFFYNGNNLDSLSFTGLEGVSSGKYFYDGDKRVMSIWYSDQTGTGIKESGRVKFFYKDNKIASDTGYEQNGLQKMIPVSAAGYEYDAKGNLIHYKQYKIEESGRAKFESWQEFQYNDKINPYYGLKYLPINHEYWNPNYRTNVLVKDEAGNILDEYKDEKENMRWNDAGYPTNFDYGSFTYECK